MVSSNSLSVGDRHHDANLVILVLRRIREVLGFVHLQEPSDIRAV